MGDRPSLRVDPLATAIKHGRSRCCQVRPSQLLASDLPLSICIPILAPQRHRTNSSSNSNGMCARLMSLVPTSRHQHRRNRSPSLFPHVQHFPLSRSTRAHAHTHTDTHTHTHTHAHTHTHTRAHAHRRAHTHTRTHAHRRTHAHVHITRSCTRTSHTHITLPFPPLPSMVGGDAMDSLGHLNGQDDPEGGEGEDELHSGGVSTRQGAADAATIASCSKRGRKRIIGPKTCGLCSSASDTADPVAASTTSSMTLDLRWAYPPRNGVAQGQYCWYCAKVCEVGEHYVNKSITEVKKLVRNSDAGACDVFLHRCARLCRRFVACDCDRSPLKNESSERGAPALFNHIVNWLWACTCSSLLIRRRKRVGV